MSAFFSGNLIPLPEEIVILIIGHFSRINDFDFTLVWFTVISALFLVDLIVFYLIKINSPYINKMKEYVADLKFIKEHEVFIKKHIYLSIFGFRMVPLLRYAGVALSSSLKIPLHLFVLYDLISVIIYSFVFIKLGYLLGVRLEEVIDKTNTIHHTLVMIVVATIGIGLTIYIHKIINRYLKTKQINL